MSRDAVFIEIQEIRAQMEGLNPSTSSYKDLAERLKALKAKVDNISVPSKKQLKKQRGYYVPY